MKTSYSRKSCDDSHTRDRDRIPLTRTEFGILECLMKRRDRHGGGIEIESSLDRGSTFRVRLPASIHRVK